MGEVTLDDKSMECIIHSDIILYGDAASQTLAEKVAEDIRTRWNEPRASIVIRQQTYTVVFDVSGFYEKDLQPEKVWYNDNPRMNFFRVEAYASGNISFVDGIGCNTGYFKLDNLLQTGTTAAHEYGHTIGLVHPTNLDIRGQGIPGIMYPRGTICDAQFQYDPAISPGQKGGTLNPEHRRVKSADIDLLNLPGILNYTTEKAIIGDFSSLFHAAHHP